MDQNVGAVVMLIGIAVGVDYTLFYLRREREERAAGRGERAALEAAAATSGRSVLVSGATVMIAMAGMLFSGDKTFMSFSVATMIVVAVAMLGSLTVLPAVLSKLGDRVEKGRIPLLGRFRRPPARGGSGQGSSPRCSGARPSRRRSRAAAARAGDPGAEHPHRSVGMNSLPRSTPTVETLDRVQAAFPGQASPAVIAIKTDTTSPAFQAAVAEPARRRQRSGQGYGAISVEANPSHTVARIGIPLPGNGNDGSLEPGALTLRDELLPATIGKSPAHGTR